MFFLETELSRYISKFKNKMVNILNDQNIINIHYIRMTRIERNRYLTPTTMDEGS